MKLLMLGDIYGKTGRESIASLIPELKKIYEPDWIIANGENTTAGNGLSAKHAKFLKEAGIDVITTGNHIFCRADWPDVLANHDYILRPHNMLKEGDCGTGCRIFTKKDKPSIAVINLAGRVFMETCSCPFETFDKLYKTLPSDIPLIVDFHGEATSEKLALFWYVNGRASIAYGTHTHVQTSDNRILPNGGTGVVTDLGMSGAVDGIIGVDRQTVVGRFLTGYSEKFLCAQGQGKVEGLFAELDGKFPVKLELVRITTNNANTRSK